jgi:predicted RND superfamily exporter protein
MARGCDHGNVFLIFSLIFYVTFFITGLGFSFLFFIIFLPFLLSSFPSFQQVRSSMDHRREKECKKINQKQLFGPWANILHAHLLFYFILKNEKNVITFFTNNNSFGPWANKLWAHLQKN